MSNSESRNVTKSGRIKQIKETLRKEHEIETERRIKTYEDPDPFNRFSKYRRSLGSENHVSRLMKRVGSIIPNDQRYEDGTLIPLDVCSYEKEQFGFDNLPLPAFYDRRVDGESMSSKVQDLTSCFENHHERDPISRRVQGWKSFQTKKTVHKKPNIPLILQAGEPMTDANSSAALNRKKKPSILKKKDENHSSGGASVSFDLDTGIQASRSITRTKSTDSNSSCDIETGYWSGGENLTGGILKCRLKDLQNDGDQKSILKDHRRSSLGNPSLSPESSLHSILKRKLSYDSSILMHNSNSFSTNSLDCMSPEPKPILKKKSSSEELDDTEWTNPKPILKKNSLRGDHSHSSSSDGLDDSGGGGIRPILKKPVKVEEKCWESDGNLQTGRSILKRIGDKGSSKYYSFEDSICHIPDDRLSTKSVSGCSGKRRHGSLPNSEWSKGNDVNTLLQMENVRTESEEDIIMTLSVAEKRSIFLQMDRDRERDRQRSTIGRMDKRHATQPVTLDEIEKASQLMQQISSISIDQLKNNIMNDESKELLGSMLGELSERNSTDPPIATSSEKKVIIPRSASVGESSPASTPLPSLDNVAGTTSTEKENLTLVNKGSSSEDDPSKLSLRDRVRMFNNFALTQPSSYLRPVKRVVTSKRFQTQPVTNLEHRHIQDCVGSGPCAPKESVAKTFQAQLSKGDEEIECGGDDDMPEKISYSSAEDEPLDYEDHEESFIKRRLKSSSYEINRMEDEALISEKGGSIAEKIAALKTNGEMNWKKRICKPIIKKVLVDESDNHKNIDVVGNNKDSPSVVANRLSLLEKSQAGWKQRVCENDATLFTVQSKLEKAGKLKDSPLSLTEKKHNSANNNVLSPIKFTSKTSKNPALTAELEKRVLNVGKKIPTPQVSPNTKSIAPEELDEEHVVRNVSSNDNEAFRSFFPSVTVIGSMTPDSGTNISFDEIQVVDRQYLGLRKNIKVNRTHGHVRNPIKSLASRLPEQSYKELKPEEREKELKKRIQIENLSKTSHLSIEALAGLASKEDFTAVKLKRAQSELRAQEYPYPMLIRIKGKRFVQIRLVPPQMSSLSSGDCFILITKEKIYQYIGEFSNRMEKSKLTDTISHIIQKRDLGTHLNSIAEVIPIEEPIITERSTVETFYKILGGGNRCAIEDEKLGDEADEEYEGGVIRTNRVFQVDPEKEELIPLLSEGGWGSQPKYSILKEDRVLVFDFGSEMYVWSGSRADVELKRIGTRLAREMFQDSYNFSEVCDEYSPLGSLVVGDKRPNWCWFKRINHHMEPILFIEKFFDWPDDSGKLIRVKSASGTSGKDGGFNFTACDVDQMLQAVKEIDDPILELEGFNVARGSEIHDEKENRHYTLTTLDVQTWRISEFSKNTVDATSFGHFYSTETYVVRWYYSVMQVGRDLKGNQSKFGGILGRARTSYFFWHGKDSKVTEQGTSALMTVELDQEKGPQIRVVQGREPPAFLALFRGLMFVHLGSPEESKQRVRRLYVTLGCAEAEGHFVEVPLEPSSFRSRGSFLILDKESKNLCVWHGSQSSLNDQKIAQEGATYISNSPSEFDISKSLRLSNMKEGNESHEVWERLGMKTEMEWREAYTSLQMTSMGSECTSQITVFHFTSLNGVLETKLLLSPKRKANVVQSFPILQEDLYNVQQPGLFLVTNGHDAWLWHGWRPRGDEENENTATGSGEYRWAAERKAALETGVEYMRHRDGRSLLVYAGMEPPLFRCLFPYWSTHQEARACNLGDGKSENSLASFSTALETFKKSTYTLEELQERPEGVDLLKLENYLTDFDFQSLVKMSREEFNKLQQWRKDEVKKQVGLF